MGKALFVSAACVFICSCGVMVGEETGKKVYDSACLACHSTGAAGAPRMGDKQGWQQRAEQGFDTLVSHAINGKPGMPPRGGDPSLTDDEIKKAVAYLLARSGSPTN